MMPSANIGLMLINNSHSFTMLSVPVDVNKEDFLKQAVPAWEPVLRDPSGGTMLSQCRCNAHSATVPGKAES